MSQSIVIAIDGPAASGKGTLARKLAARFGLPHLDTGLTYRAVAHELLTKSLPLDSEALAAEEAGKVELQKLDRDVLSLHTVGEVASRIAVFSQVRRVLVEKQRAFARMPGGAVLDGRDIGTVVCPDADVKLYVTASSAVRAARRLAEMEAKGGSGDLFAIQADIEMRDSRDSERSDSPLKPAADAHLLDTSEMDIDAAFSAAVAIVERILVAKAKA